MNSIDALLHASRNDVLNMKLLSSLLFPSSFLVIFVTSSLPSIQSYRLPSSSSSSSSSLLPSRQYQYKSRYSSYNMKLTSQILQNDQKASKSLSFLTLIGASAKNTVSSIAMVVVLLSSSSWSPLFYIIMGVFNAVLSKILKDIVKQPRPILSSKPGFGMPSSHAQSLFYFSTVLSLTFLRSALFTKSFLILSLISSILIFSYAVLASSWRVVNNLHTIQQTIVGCFIGILSGFLAFYLETHSLIPESIYIKHDFIIYKISCLNFASNWIKDNLSTTSVPVLLRAFVLLLGGLVLYSKEIKKSLIKKSNVSTQ